MLFRSRNTTRLELDHIDGGQGQGTRHRRAMASMAAWLREAVRRVTRDDFPDSWRTGVIGGRSHDSQTYGQRFMLRLDESTSQKLQHLAQAK